MPAPAPEQTLSETAAPTSGTHPRSRWSAAALAVVLGILAGLFGTVLHLQLSWLGGILLPWGALLALILVAAVQLWAALSTRELWVGGIVAVAAFTTVLLMRYWPGSDSFSVGLDQYTLQMLPGPAVAGALWQWGVPAVGVALMLVSQRLLRGVGHPVRSAGTHTV